MTFDEAEALQTLPRLVFALLRSPLLSPRELRHPDARAAIGRLWAALPPDHLRRAVYPALSSFADPDTLVLLSTRGKAERKIRNKAWEIGTLDREFSCTTCRASLFNAFLLRPAWQLGPATRLAPVSPRNHDTKRKQKCRS